MKYLSTRGGDSATFEEAISTGYARDGGLYLPEKIPTVTNEELAEMIDLSFLQVFEKIAWLFVSGEMPIEDLRRIIDRSFHEFSAEEVVPVVKVGDSYVAELFHGPTYAFKDFGQQVLCGMLDYFAAKRGSSSLLIVSTTGDTGPAAIRAVNGLSCLSIICFYPQGQVSTLQEMQMITVDSPNVQVYTFEGGGDDMDAPIKTVTTDAELQRKHGLSSVNSINIGRIVAQGVHFFYSYLQVVKQEGLKVGAVVDFAVPCGALGNVTAGLLAKKMGLPVGRIISGTNENDIFHRVISTGDFTRHPEMKKTMSEAINIQVPYNFERILSLLSDGDTVKVNAWMSDVEQKGGFQLDSDTLTALQEHFVSSRVSDSEMLDTMRAEMREHKYLVDPHTAVAFRAVEACSASLSPRAPCCILATAHGCKFEKAVREGLGDAFWGGDMCALMPPSAAGLESKSTHRRGVFKAGADWTRDLKGLLSELKP